MSQDIEIDVRVKALSKSSRLLPEGRLYDIAREALDGEANRIYERLDSEDPEYHVLDGEYAVVLKVHSGTAFVVTQMHQHPSYGTNDKYRKRERAEVKDDGN